MAYTKLNKTPIKFQVLRGASANHTASVDSLGATGELLYLTDTNQLFIHNGTAYVEIQYWVLSGTDLYYTGGNVGIGTTSPGAKLHVAGIITSPDTGDDSERFGLGSGATGSDTVAFGFESIASGAASTAIGSRAAATEADSTAVGRNSAGSGSGGTAIGQEAVASGARSTALGNGADATATDAVALGANSAASASAAFSIGTFSIASQGSAIAIGKSSEATASFSLALGSSADAGASGSMAIGANASSQWTNSIALGRDTTATGNYQFVVGENGRRIEEIYFGRGVTAAGAANITINATGGEGTDINGGSLTLAGGKPTGSGSGGDIIFQTAEAGSTGTTLRSLVERVRILDTGNVGIGETTPTAALHLKAGTATANTAPLKFTSGTLLTTPEAGVVEYSNDRYHITDVATRRVIDRTSDVVTSTTTVSDTVTETTVYTGTIAANALKVGNILKIFTSGVITNATASDDITINVYIGSTLIQTYNPAIGNVTGADWHTSTQLAVRSLGATGSIAVHGEVHLDSNTQYDNSIQTVDTTAAEDITVKVQWDNAKAGNTISLYQGHLEFKN